MTIVSVEEIDVHYGDLQVLRDVSLTVDDDESVVAVIGPNGAGKTTLLKAISGIIDISDGRIEILGTDRSSVSPHEVVEHGFVHVPQERNLFTDMTVVDNLRMGAYSKRDDDNDETIESVYEMFPVLEERKEQKAGTLSGGQQQMLAIGRGLMAKPEVIALDEPSAGLAPQLSQRVFEKIEEISEDTTVILVEQHVEQTLKLADKAYLLENGGITAEGTGESMLERDVVKEGFIR